MMDLKNTGLDSIKGADHNKNLSSTKGYLFYFFYFLPHNDFLIGKEFAKISVNCICCCVYE